MGTPEGGQASPLKTLRGGGKKGTVDAAAAAAAAPIASATETSLKYLKGYLECTEWQWFPDLPA